MPSQIVINVSAGTAQLVKDLEEAKGKVRTFGQSTISETRAAAAEFKILEGNITNNARAAEAFVTKFLGGGAAVKALFPVAGAIAFGGIMVDIGEKAYQAFLKMRNGAAEARNAFQNL